jgi:hypothetical protein
MTEAPVPAPAAPEPLDVDRWLHGGLEAADPALVAEGWERRFVTEGRRAEEFGELYRQLGLEVRLEPVNPSHLPDDCGDCRLITLLQFRAVYTRKPQDGGD